MKLCKEFLKEREGGTLAKQEGRKNYEFNDQVQNRSEIFLLIYFSSLSFKKSFSLRNICLSGNTFNYDSVSSMVWKDGDEDWVLFILKNKIRWI